MAEEIWEWVDKLKVPHRCKAALKNANIKSKEELEKAIDEKKFHYRKIKNLGIVSYSKVLDAINYNHNGLVHRKKVMNCCPNCGHKLK